MNSQKFLICSGIVDINLAASFNLSLILDHGLKIAHFLLYRFEI